MCGNGRDESGGRSCAAPRGWARACPAAANAISAARTSAWDNRGRLPVERNTVVGRGSGRTIGDAEQKPAPCVLLEPVMDLEVRFPKVQTCGRPVGTRDDCLRRSIFTGSGILFRRYSDVQFSFSAVFFHFCRGWKNRSILRAILRYVFELRYGSCFKRTIVCLCIHIHDPAFKRQSRG